MAITLEVKLCLSNSSRGMERKTEGNQSTNVTLIFTSPVDLFLIPYFRPISADFQKICSYSQSHFDILLS